jgi:hypothetical protein
MLFRWATAQPSGNTMITTNYSCLSMRHACAMTERATVLAATLATLAGLAVLTHGVSYVCRVRAKASVGYGPWSRGTKLAG